MIRFHPGQRFSSLGIIEHEVEVRAVARIGGVKLGSEVVAVSPSQAVQHRAGRQDQPTPAVTSPNEAKPRPVLGQAKTKALLPTPMVERTPTNVEIVNKALNRGGLGSQCPAAARRSVGWLWQ